MDNRGDDTDTRTASQTDQQKPDRPINTRVKYPYGSRGIKTFCVCQLRELVLCPSQSEGRGPSQHRGL